MAQVVQWLRGPCHVPPCCIQEVAFRGAPLAASASKSATLPPVPLKRWVPWVDTACVLPSAAELLLYVGFWETHTMHVHSRLGPY